MTPPPIEAVLACIEADARAGRVDGWSWSTVIDEKVGEAVVERELFERIHEVGGVDARFPVGNAGLIHVYGYLFSTVRTPYGYKSDRWNDGVLAGALGLPDGWFRLGDSATETPLQRVSDAARPLLADPSRSSQVAEWEADGIRQRAVITPPAGGGSAALVSGIDDGSGMKLLTIFPVGDTAAFFRDTLAGEPRLRWNAARPPSPWPQTRRRVPVTDA
ncbi:hypothetical protein GCM10010915_27910 [Microbacterium faecale]|uniref:Amino acid deaminase n=2 Tax=Microbacterium faecale TaxID=1804630 RepID=A0A917DK57_9MICO|nr:hypothetical protein GCM10010915_27910 [Microbacterium faecale]